jgi:hypothetical protein
LGVFTKSKKKEIIEIRQTVQFIKENYLLEQGDKR